MWLTSPVIAAALIAVRLDSNGPVFYLSRRVGKDGIEFDLLKIRTMYVMPKDSGPEVTSGSDERITHVGRFLRKTKIDELPQLLNVLKGDVSLVGPRPEAPKYVAKYPLEYKKILSVKPGLSDRATLEFVDEEEILAKSKDPEKTYIEEILPQKIAYYLKYVEHQSMLEDLSIILGTVENVAKRSFQVLAGRIK